jgi:hypothetical protein
VTQEEVVSTSSITRAAEPVTGDDERLLHRLGYPQELFRGMGGFRNFAISFSIISILAGCLPSCFLAFQVAGTAGE